MCCKVFTVVFVFVVRVFLYLATEEDSRQMGNNPKTAECSSEQKSRVAQGKSGAMVINPHCYSFCV